MPAQQPDPGPTSTLARRLADAARATARRREERRSSAALFLLSTRCGAVVGTDDASGAPVEWCDLPEGHDGWCEDDPAGRIAVLEGVLAATEQQRDRYARLLARVAAEHGLRVVADLSDQGAETFARRVEQWLDRRGGQR